MEAPWTSGAQAPDSGSVPASDDAQQAVALTRDFKQAMRRLTAAVSIVATREHEARFGMTATALSAVCAQPPAMLVCINHGATLYAPLQRMRRFSVNLLHEGQHDLIAPFSGKLAHDARFAFGAWRDVDDLPVLEGAQATLLCSVDGSMHYGTHDVVIGRVDAVAVMGAVAPLLWQDGGPAAARALSA